MQNIKINKVAIGFDYNEKKETNILNSFYVQAVSQASYNFPDMFGFSDIKFIFETAMSGGYGCSDRYLDGTCHYLSGSLNCGNFSLPSICSLDFSCPEKEEEEEGCDRGALDQAKINFKLGKFCTKGVTVGADAGDADNRLQLNTGSTQAINGLELEFKNNEAGDVSAAWFKGTNSCECATVIGSSMEVTASSTWANGATTTITVDPVANKELLETLQDGDIFKDKNGDALFGIGTYVDHTAAGVITINSAVVSQVSTAEVKTAAAANAVSVPIKTANATGLVLGKPLYAHTAVPNTLALLGTEYLGDATQNGTVAIDANLEFNFGIANACVVGDEIWQSTGAHFKAVPTVGGTLAERTVTVELSAGNPNADDFLVDNNVTGYRLKIKLGRFGSIGYEDIETDNSGTITNDITTCVRLGFCNSTDLGDLDQVTRGAGNILSNISLDWVNHENKIGAGATTSQEIIAIQYKLSDEMSLMYGQKTHTDDKTSDIYGLNYKMNVGNDTNVLLKVRGQSEDNDQEHAKLQIKLELPADSV